MTDYTELVERLRVVTVTISEAMRQRMQAANAIESLQARLGAVREIYAGAEGFQPQTAPEAYCLRIIQQMGQAAMGVGDE